MLDNAKVVFSRFYITVNFKDKIDNIQNVNRRKG